MSKISNYTAVVTGGAGTCGNLLVNKLVFSGKYRNVISVDNDESSLFYQSQKYANNSVYNYAYADICNTKIMCDIFDGAKTIFHCAASKNVPMCETSPGTCVNTNIKGVESVIYAAKRVSVEKLLFTSSDKAVNPTNVMGATKLIGEKLLSGAHYSLGKKSSKETIFTTTRFGNVIGSKGSVLPLFLSQIINGIPLTITDPEMTRFMMSQNQAVDLIILSSELSNGGEIFITKMPVIRIGTFAEALFELCIEAGLIKKQKFNYQNINIIGMRDGEKKYEELMYQDEIPRSRESDDFLVVLPSCTDIKMYSDQSNKINKWPKSSRVYNSSLIPPLNLEDTKAFISSSMERDKINLIDFNEKNSVY